MCCLSAEGIAQVVNSLKLQYLYTSKNLVFAENRRRHFKSARGQRNLIN